MRARLQAYRNGCCMAAEECVAAIADRAASLAMGLAPEGSGPRREKRLKSSFSSRTERAGDCAIGVAFVQNPHAAYVEFGTGRRGAASGSGTGYDPDWPGMAAQPYMQPAADAMRSVFPGEVTREMRKVGRR